MSLNKQICLRCVMDDTADDFNVDENGICNYCMDYQERLKNIPYLREDNGRILDELVSQVKRAGINRKYDCIIGLSGGLDSSYLLYQAVRLGLRPLAVHLDNGWNSELSVNNIESLIKGLGIDLHTHVINWNEFRSLQRAFFKAGVIDIELLTDHAIIAICYKMAVRHNVKYLIAGTNTANEGMRMPRSWNHFKWDIKNIFDIHKKFGDGIKISTYPKIYPLQYAYYRFIKKVKWLSLLDYMYFDKSRATQELKESFGYKPYLKKHYESIFTRFYQAYILPNKFNVDKRKLHYSTLIISGQMSRDEALADLQCDPYNDELLKQQDKDFVIKKLKITKNEFEEYILKDPLKHSVYKTNVNLLAYYRRLFK